MKKTIKIIDFFERELYKYTCNNNNIKKTIENAVKNNISLCRAELSHIDLSYTNLSDANLSGANLSFTNLKGANLKGANLQMANLEGADITNVKTDFTTSMFLPQCPDGEFIGYKKARNKIVKLLILADAKRSSATTLKCRCSKAKVLEIQNQNGSLSKFKSVRSNYDRSFIYRVGEIVSVDNFDEDRWNECSSGIHFFISREAAVNY